MVQLGDDFYNEQIVLTRKLRKKVSKKDTTIPDRRIMIVPADATLSARAFGFECSPHTCTMVGSCLLPSTNSSNVSLASLSRSIFLKILSTL